MDNLIASRLLPTAGSRVISLRQLRLSLKKMKKKSCQIIHMNPTSVRGNMGTTVEA
jgi:hypothetical protein